MHINLRRADLTDATVLAHILISSRQVFLPYAPLKHSAAAMQTWVAETLLPSGGCTVAMVAGKVVGVLATSHDGQVHWIDQLYLDPAYVGKGIGRQLLQHALEQVSCPVRLYTFQQNTTARRFYESHGFIALEFGDGSGNEEKCPDVLYELR